MEKNNKIIDEMAKLFGDGLASLGNCKNELESFIKTKTESYLLKMDFIPRQEYQILYDMVSKLRLDKLDKKSK